MIQENYYAVEDGFRVLHGPVLGGLCMIGSAAACTFLGLLHDVGKIGVPDAVINKPEKLTEAEYDIIKTRPVLGAKILGNIQAMPSLQMGARWHHERFDGNGYPDGLSGENIPEEARIIAVADAYDAMTSHRSYRASLPQEVVREEIEKCSGKQFDPRFARIMLAMMDEDKEYEMREKTGRVL